MQASQRTECNHALEYAVLEANEKNRPLVVFFGITPRFPEANARHYAFMLEGLQEVKDSLRDRGVKFVIWQKSPEIGAVELSKRACLIVVDCGYTKIEKKWRREVSAKIDCPLIQVETNVIVPVVEASSKEEYAAATFRPKMGRQLEKYLLPLKEKAVKKEPHELDFESFDLDDVEKALARLPIERSVGGVSSFHGGTSQAKKFLGKFVQDKLDHYPEWKNDPTVDGTSLLSPYLHFGQISPLYIALKVKKKKGRATDAFLEELIIRRELSMNFVHYNERYDQFEGLPSWCRQTLREHERDRREYIYSLSEFEKAKTHDPYWNAAQKEMVLQGKMHGTMRMYWGKKIMEWSQKPEHAFKRALYLNNKYELDGRDPNGFAGVSWCFGKHDRAWPEGSILGNVRTMKASGLLRKFDADAYVRKIEKLTS